MEKGVTLWLRENAADGWHRAMVLRIDKDQRKSECQVQVQIVEGPQHATEKTLTIDLPALEDEKMEHVMLANSNDMDLVEDLIQLPHLHEPGICHTLNERFKINEIYTLTGEILLAINPFKNIGIYSDKIIRKYIRNGDKKAAGTEVAEMPPHVFSVADKAYRSLMNPLTTNSSGKSDQSILVSGESGAGKTESTKFIMQYLAVISANQKGEEDHIMEQILSSNPILESFGNARTIRNDNSSRFGKFIKMQFSDRGTLIGASIQTYLLEKIRLAYQAESERNYHIFYEIIAGASSVEKERWKLMSPKKFHYLNQSTCTKRKDGVDDAEQFRLLKNAMTVMGFEPEDIESIFVTVATLLHLGNLDFEETTHEGSGVDGSKISGTCDDSMQVVLNYLEVDQHGLEQALCFRKIQAKEEKYSISLEPDAAENTRDSLSRFLYGKLFDWLVTQINVMVECKEDPHGFIGLLDIFGFEDLAHNSFEQLCINYANETLQQHFNLTVLRLEQEIYEKEKIKWSFINYPDNSSCIELIQGKPFGILNALDEECIVPQGNDRNFARKLYRQHEKHDNFSADKTEQANHLFVIHHYAGQVTYDSFGFCDKNKDILYAEITNLLKRSSKPFIRNLLKADSVSSSFSGPRGRHGHKPKGILKANTTNKVSLGSQFRTQLKELIETIGKTSCHYVRCLKPNDHAKSSTFVPERICDQLKAGGVLEAVRVNQAGYPVRMTHQQFLRRYRPILNGEYLRRIPEKLTSEEICDPTERKQGSSLLAKFLLNAHAKRYPDQSEQERATASIQVGLTKVFFRRSVIQFVEGQLAKRYGEFVVLIQAWVRRFVLRCKYLRMKICVVHMQRVVRGHIARCRFVNIRERYRQQQAALRKQRELEEKEREKERLRLLEEKERSTERSTEKSVQSSLGSDPISDDSEDDSNNPAPLRQRPTARVSRGTTRFRFTKDYGYEFGVEGGDRVTVAEGPRSVAMDPGDTVLHVAANCCNERDVLKLLENGSDINAKNRRGRTPLHTASLHHNLEVVGILLDWEADVCAQDNDGNTPLHLAKDPHVAKMLLEAGANPNFVNADGRTPLIEAVDRGDVHIVKALMRFKADVLFRELKHHQTALHLAVRKGHYAIVMELCQSEDRKELVLLTDRNENNALHFAVARDRKNGPRLVNFLIKRGSEVDKVNARLQTPLAVHIMTTRQTDPAISDLLLNHGADPNVTMPDGSTLLHVAVERDLPDIACSLIRKGANLNEPDAKGRLVIEVANRRYLRRLLSCISAPPKWINDSDRRQCMVCGNNFKFGTRRHHCRHCGRVCCNECSSFQVELHRFPKEFPGRITSGGKSVKDGQRVCKTCYGIFKARTAHKEQKSGFMARVLGYEWDEVGQHQT